MASQLAHSTHLRVLPQGQLILLKPMARDQLFVALVPEQRAHLRVRVVRLEQRTIIHIPDANLSVRCAAARR